MADRKVKVATPTGEATGVAVEVAESTERWSDITLEDGVTLRIKATVVSAVRVDGQYDPQGNPSYVLNMTPTITLVHCPENLRKKVQ
jgi:hypothetical protein